MASILDSNTAMQALADYLGVTYAQAQKAIIDGAVVFTLPITDPDIAVNMTGAVGMAIPDPAGRTAVSKWLKQTTVANTQYILFTPTSGKKFYVTSITIAFDGAATMVLGDDVDATPPASGSIENSWVAVNFDAGAAPPSQSISFTVPMVCSTNFSFTVAQIGDARISVTGWEE